METRGCEPSPGGKILDMAPRVPSPLEYVDEPFQRGPLLLLLPGVAFSRNIRAGKYLMDPLRGSKQKMPGWISSCVEGAYKSLSVLTPLTAWRHFENLSGNQWLSYDELAVLRWKKLRRLLQHCAENVPFYRDLWSRHGIDPTAFSSEDDLAHLPLVTKESLTEGRVGGGFLLTNKAFQILRTSGTTGPVFQVPITRDEFQIKYAAHLRQVYASGWRLGMKSATLYNAGHPQFAGKYFGEPVADSFSHYRRLALRTAHRRISLPPYTDKVSGNFEYPERWYRQLLRHRPLLFESYEFNLAMLMEYIEATGRTKLSIPIIYVLGTLSEKRRLAFERFFSAKVFNRYSPHEMEGVAFACDRRKGMHISIDCYHVEFVDDENRVVEPNSIGHLVLTDLDNFTMPLIRYKIGDLGFLRDQPCTCGRGLPVMSDIAGRADDRLNLGDGRSIAPARLSGLLQDNTAVRHFQVVHDDSEAIRVDIVPRVGMHDAGLCDEIELRLRKIIGTSKQLSVQLVDKVALEPNGKVNLVRRD